MDTEKKPAVPAWWQCAVAGGAAGVVPVAGMLAVHLFLDVTGGLIWPDFAPGAAACIIGWSVAGLCLAASVALEWPAFRKWPMPVWMARIVQALLIPAWVSCMPAMPHLSFALLAALCICAAVSIRAPLIGHPRERRHMVAAALMCPLLLWALYMAAALYMALMITP